MVNRSGRGKLPRWDDPGQLWVGIFAAHHGPGIHGQEPESVHIVA